mgnify:CR=1 FL=1
MGKMFKTFSLGFLALLLIGVFYTSSSFAQVEEPEVTESVTPTIKRVKPENAKERIKEAREKNKQLKDKMQARVTEAALKKEERLSDARLKICEAREKNIGNRISAMKKRAEVIYKGHEKIYQRVDEFYNNKLTPDGYILSNYADLKAEIAANKENIIVAMEAVKTTGEEFDCSATDPRGQVDAFQEDMKALIEANKAYKKSIHAFVKQVRDLAKTVTPIKVSPTITTEVAP